MALQKILVVDDEPIICKSIEEVLRAQRYSVSSATSLAAAERQLKRNAFDLIFLDVKLPDGEGTDLLERLGNAPNRPLVIMMSGYGTIESAVNCMRLGAFDYLIKPFSLSQVEVIGKKAENYRQVLKVNEYLSREISGSADLVGSGPAIASLRQLIRKVGPTEATVLICGENGTGKELVANEIFKSSARAGAPYVKVNCAAISETLIESEFFGHEKGSYTGATERRDGRFELANGGTLLLDEISEISPRVQAKLLRVLQEREFERVGGNKTVKVDVRVLATTNRDLKKAVANGEFREDLFYRLNIFPLRVPALRDRKEDVMQLAETFLQRFSRRHGVKIPGFSKPAAELLRRHDWPGNVRELQNSVERAVILAEDGQPLQPEALGLLHVVEDAWHHKIVQPLTLDEPAPGEPAGANGVEFVSIEDLEREHILRALHRTSGNRTKAAELLKISVRTLRNKLNEYRLAGVKI
jgi:DNA-binding NtrC family response regulator